MKDLREEIKQKKVARKQNSNYDAISQILDEHNSDNVTLYDAQNKPIEFEQIALIPRRNKLTRLDELFTIMIPITPMQGVNEGEGVVFKIDEKSRDIEVVNDQEIIDDILDIYQKLIENGEGENEE